MKTTTLELSFPYMEGKPADFHDITDRLIWLRFFHLIWDYEFNIHPLTKEGRLYFKVPYFLRKLAVSCVLGTPLLRKHCKEGNYDEF